MCGEIFGNPQARGVTISGDALHECLQKACMVECSSVFGRPVTMETVRFHLPAACAGLVYCRKTLDALT